MSGPIIFDFDGVIADTEPLHLLAFQDALAPASITVTEDAYYDRYVGLADGLLLERILHDAGRPTTGEDYDRLLRDKRERYLRGIRTGHPLLPGARELIRQLHGRRPLAICSGAQRREIETILASNDLLDPFPIIVSAEDVSASKPDPEGYLLALERLRETNPTLTAADCLVIEDSDHGITAGRAAGMKVLAVRADASASPTAGATGEAGAAAVATVGADAIVPDLTVVDEALIHRVFDGENRIPPP